MMWPFKKREVVSMDDFVKQLPPAPCGQQKDHYYWTEFEGFSCPHCARQKKKADEDAREDRMARKIAEHVVAIMREVK